MYVICLANWSRGDAVREVHVGLTHSDVDGFGWRGVLRLQNIRVISKYYARIAFPRLAQLLKLDEDVRGGW